MSSTTIASPSSSSSRGCGSSPSLPAAAPAFSSGGGSPNRTLYGFPLLCAIPSAICRSFALTFLPPIAMTLQPFCTALLLLPVIRPLTSNVSSPMRVLASLPSVTSTDLTIRRAQLAPAGGRRDADADTRGTKERAPKTNRKSSQPIGSLHTSELVTDGGDRGAPRTTKISQQTPPKKRLDRHVAEL